MEYRILPGTDLKVSTVCMGTQQFSASGEDGVVDVTWGAVKQADVNATVNAAIEAGINFFDCALGYGGGQAERALGEALKERRDEVVVATKFGKHMPLWELDTLPANAPASTWCTVYDGEMVAAAIEESLKNLQTDRIDLYQVHWPVNVPMDDAEKLRGVVQALEAAKTAKKIRYYGVCNFGTMDLQKFLDVGGHPVTNQVPYNLVYRAIEYGVIPMCEQYGISVLCYSALQQGLLSGRVSCAADLPEGRRRTRLFKGPDQGGAVKARHGGAGVEEELFAADTGLLPRLKAMAEDEKLTLVDLATGWLLRRTAVVLVGASSPNQASRNAKVVAISDACDAKLTALGEDLKQKLGPEIDQYAKRSRVSGNELSTAEAA